MKMNRTLNVAVGKVKKSTDTKSLTWLSRKLRHERKRFLIHLVLLRMLDPEPRLAVVAAQIRRNYPRFRPGIGDAQLEKAFINNLAGRMKSEGFHDLLLDEQNRDKELLRHPCTRSPNPRAYRLELQRGAVVVKLRI